MENETVLSGKNAAIIAYITIIGCIIAIFMNMEPKNEFARFHIRQSFGLWISFYAIGFLVGFANSWAATIGFYLFFIILIIYSLSGAITGKRQKAPLVGDHFQKWFTFIV
ncbi:hypothetical protein [Sinomicrobium sp.]